MEFFSNTQTAILVRRFLRALNYTQPPTQIKIDNSTANRFIYTNINKKRYKSRDMRLYWLRDKQLQNQLNLFWEKSKNNLAEYFY